MKLYCAWSSFLQNWDRRIIKLLLFLHSNGSDRCPSRCRNHCGGDTVVQSPSTHGIYDILKGWKVPDGEA